MNAATRFGRAAALVATSAGVLSALTLLNHGYLGAQNRWPIFLGYKVLATKGALVAMGLAIVALGGVALGQRLFVAISALGYAACAVVVLATWREAAGQPGSNPLDNPLGAGGPALCMFVAAAIGLAVLVYADTLANSTTE